MVNMDFILHEAEEDGDHPRALNSVCATDKEKTSYGLNFDELTASEFGIY